MMAQREIEEVVCTSGADKAWDIAKKALAKLNADTSYNRAHEEGE